MSQINNLSFYLKVKKKKEVQTKLKASRKEEIKIRPEINEIQKTNKQNTPPSVLLILWKKINKFLIRLIKQGKERDKIQITNIVNKKRRHQCLPYKNYNSIRVYYEYTNKLDNLNEIEKSLERHKLHRKTQDLK